MSKMMRNTAIGGFALLALAGCKQETNYPVTESTTTAIVPVPGPTSIVAVPVPGPTQTVVVPVPGPTVTETVKASDAAPNP